MKDNVTFQEYQDLYAHPELVEKVLRLLDDVSQHDSIPALSEAFVRGIAEDHSHRHVLALEDAPERPGDSPEVVGVLGADASSTIELAVSPSRRNHGIGSALLESVVANLDLGGAVDVWAHGDLPAAQRLVESVGGRRTRKLLKMAVECPPESTQREQLEQGAQRARGVIAEQELRVLTYAEAAEEFGAEFVDEEWVRVNNEAFAWHPEQGGWSVDKLRTARETDWFAPEGVWMLWAEDPVSEEVRCLGFHWTKLPVEEREKPFGEQVGEVYVVCLADEARGRGLGGPITLVGLGALLEAGAGTVELYVEGDNAPAVATYEHLGFEIVQVDVVYRGEAAEQPEQSE